MIINAASSKSGVGGGGGGACSGGGEFKGLVSQFSAVILMLRVALSGGAQRGIVGDRDTAAVAGSRQLAAVNGSCRDLPHSFILTLVLTLSLVPGLQD